MLLEEGMSTSYHLISSTIVVDSLLQQLILMPDLVHEDYDNSEQSYKDLLNSLNNNNYPVD